MNNKATNLIAFILLVITASTAFLSMKDDALTFDELAHIVAGYSYLAKQDYRVNPEHPPLIKNIPALPLLFLDLNFPEESPNWTQEQAPAWWVQFDLGTEFIYNSGNNPREIIFWSRLAMIVLLVLVGWFIFYWAKKIGGNAVGLGALFLFSFSPTFLAHGRLVNTDIGAVLGVLVALFFWLKFLEAPNKLNVFLAGIAFGLAMILKFSLVLLIPFFAVLTVVYPIFFADSKKKIVKSVLAYSGKAILAALIGVVFVIWPVYQFHVLNYPQEQQLRDTLADISSHPVPVMTDFALWLANQEITRPLAQYLRGLLMASQRTMWGNTAFLMGEVSAASWLYYFPVLYLLKMPLAFHLLSFFVLMGGIYKLYLIFKAGKLTERIRKNFVLFAFLVWIAIYLLAALIGNLNIGVRHLLPIFPFLYIIVVLGAVQLKKAGLALLFFIFAWYAYSSLSVFPHYISYYNELAGGTAQGYKIAVDSNYDWGQDFYRLLLFVENPPDGEKIDKINLDYFGGESPQYWLGEKYVKFDPKETEEKPQGWLAVSVNQLQGGRGRPAPDFDQPYGYYQWLDQYNPVAKAGHSIFIYRLD